MPQLRCIGSFGTSMRSALVLAATWILLTSAGQAQAETIPITDSVVADGKRWAAWKPNPSQAVVYDHSTTRRASSTSTVPNSPDLCAPD
jgi:hypothetical protein